jgi:undecaprenyl diphosphate synthase
MAMDGGCNRENLPRIAGHKEGIESVREIVKASSQLGIGYLTLYAFFYRKLEKDRLPKFKD